MNKTALTTVAISLGLYGVELPSERGAVRDTRLELHAYAGMGLVCARSAFGCSF